DPAGLLVEHLAEIFVLSGLRERLVSPGGPLVVDVAQRDDVGAEPAHRGEVAAPMPAAPVPAAWVRSVPPPEAPAARAWPGAGAEVAMAEDRVKHAALAEGPRPGHRPGHALVLDGRQRLHVGLHLHVVVKLVRQGEVLQALGNGTGAVDDLDGVGPLVVLAVGQ